MAVTYDLITETVLTTNQTTITFSSISSSYDVLILSFGGLTSSDTGWGVALQGRYNTSSSSIYHQHRNYHAPWSGFGGDSGLSETAQNYNTLNGTGDGDNSPLNNGWTTGGQIIFPNANNSGQYKRFMEEGMSPTAYYYLQWGGANDSNPISTLTIHAQINVPSAFKAGSRFCLYGLVRA